MLTNSKGVAAVLAGEWQPQPLQNLVGFIKVRRRISAFAATQATDCNVNVMFERPRRR